MRVALLYDSLSPPQKRAAKSLEEGVAVQGHQTTLVDISSGDPSSLFLYDYIILGTQALGPLSAKIPPQLGIFLKNSAALGGKKCYAYVIKRGLFSRKALRGLLSILEGEGLFIRLSDVIRSNSQARDIGMRLIIR